MKMHKMIRALTLGGMALCSAAPASAKDMRVAEDRVVVGNMYAPF